MGIELGSRLGAYEIVSLLGVGGMGEVYRARDTKLQRDVALKVLPDAFSSDPERLARFEREAQLLASLNHPNIAVIHGVEEGRPVHRTSPGADGSPPGSASSVRALVLELIDGETLAERLARGALPLGEAVEIAQQITVALAAAHEHSVIHRDLKPANIKIRADGTVKVLDFGLAKALESAQASSSPAAATLISPAMTRHDMILGTAAYMSPEQARGRAADERSDIWAFGCVLFEMLAGGRVFGGDEISDTMAAVLRAEPEWARLPVDTPPNIRRLLRRCLEKDPKRRLADVRDARLELDEAADVAPVAVAPSSRSAWRERAAWTVAALSLVAAIVAAALLRPRTAQVAAPVSRQLSIMPPENTRLVVEQRPFAISPDGRQLVFVAAGTDGVSRLWVRPLDSLTANVLPGTELAIAPFWSPDSRFIGFFADGKLQRTDARGGPAQLLTEAPSTFGVAGSWSAEDVILFGGGIGEPIQQISALGGQATTVVPAAGALATEPFFLPDGRRFLYTVFIGPVAAKVFLGSLDGGDPRFLFDTNSGAVQASGHLVYVKAGELIAQPFDATLGSVTGAGAAIAEPVPGTSITFSASNDGTLVYRRTGQLNRLVWVDRAGKQAAVAAPVSAYGAWSLSSDDQRVAFDRTNGSGMDVWIFDIQRQIPSRLTTRTTLSNVPIWSPDDDTIAFATLGDIGLDIYRRAGSGAGDDEPLVKLDAQPIVFPSDWSPDGKVLTYYRTSDETNLDTWMLPLEPGSQPIAFLQSRFNESQGQFSPDGKWFAYVSDQSGQPQVYVTGFPTPGGREQVSMAGGVQPRWRPDGRELFYLAPDGNLMAVAVQLGDTFTAETPRVLFATTLQRDALRQTYEVSSDGARFLLQVPVETSPSFTVVLDWPALLSR